METITQFRLPDGTVVTLEDWVDRPVFSVVELLTGFNDGEIDFFTYNQGEDVPASGNATVRRTGTEADTNISVAGGNVSTEELLVYALKPEMFALQTAAQTPTDLTTAAITVPGQPMMRISVLKQMHMTLMLRLKISQKAYAEAGFGYFPTGFDANGQGVVQGATLSDANRQTYASQGWPSQDAVRSFAVPYHIGGTEKYRAELRNYPGDTITFVDENAATNAGTLRLVVRIRLYLDGMRKRPTA